MDSKAKLKTIFSEVCDQKARDLALISLIRQKENKSTENSIKSESEIYLDLVSEVFVMFDIKPNQLSPIEELVVVCDNLKSISNKFELKQLNESMERLLIELKANSDSFDHKFLESVRETKSQQTFEAVLSNKIQFYSNKFKEYYNSIKTKENSLSKIGFTSTIRHESIEEMRRTNEEMKSRFNDINQRLNEYKDFVPTEADLKNKISEIKVQINEYDNYFNKL